MTVQLDHEPGLRAAGVAPPPAPSVLASATIPTFGSLAWMAWFWLGLGLLVSGIGVALAMGDGPESSLWDGAVNLLPWLTFAAGISMVPSFGPMFIANGTTRAHLASAATVALVVLAALSGVIAFVGFIAEDLAYAALGWPHVQEGAGPIGGTLDQLGVSASLAVVAACFAASGWLVGVAWQRTRNAWFAVWLVPALLPIGASHLLIDRGAGELARVAVGSLLVGSLVAMLVAAAATALAVRLTRDVRFPP